MRAPERFAAAIARVFTRPVRLWLYGIGVAAVPLTTIYGVMTVEQGGAWLVFVGAVLGMSELGMAALNTRKPQVGALVDVPGGQVEVYRDDKPVWQGDVD